MKNKIKHKFLGLVIILIFMFFVSYKTINYLYKTNSLSSDEYIKLLLSDSYDNNFYIKIVDLFSKKFNPTNIIELPKIEYKKLKSSGNNPIIYLINTNQELYYKNEFNMKPDIVLSTYLLNESLNNNLIQSIYQSTNIKEFSKLNDIDNALDILMNETLDNNTSIKYIINIGINYDKSIIKHDNNAYIYLYINESNYEFMNKLNISINKTKPISKIYYENNTYNHIDIGSTNNSMHEVIKSIKILSNAFKEVIY